MFLCNFLLQNLVGCIWQFNGCVEHLPVPEPECFERFEDCKMIVMGMMPVPDNDIGEVFLEENLEKRHSKKYN